MDLIKDIKYENTYCDTKMNKYTQCNITVDDNIVECMTTSKSLEELLLHTYDYVSILKKNDKNYIDTRKIEFATLLDEESNTTYDNFNYDKRFSKKLLQRGLQENDTLSTILYLSDLYNFGLVIYDKDYNKYYKLYTKSKPEVYICYENKYFRNMETPSDMLNIKYMEDLSGLSNMLNMNLKDIYIYKKYLKPISNYKIDELKKIAKELDVDIMKNGKCMNKQELYNMINLSKY
jgi:hypothetical protein